MILFLYIFDEYRKCLNEWKFNFVPFILRPRLFSILEYFEAIYSDEERKIYE